MTLEVTDLGSRKDGKPNCRNDGGRVRAWTPEAPHFQTKKNEKTKTGYTYRIRHRNGIGGYYIREEQSVDLRNQSRLKRQGTGERSTGEKRRSKKKMKKIEVR
jgi:hypothetical protein